jgi:hypothetical protein
MTPRSIGPTGSLALAVHHRWEPNSLWMIVTSYFDMSGPDRRIPLMVYGGFVAKLGQWNRFDAKWRKMLKRAGLTYFRAKEMRHGEGEFRGWGDDQKEKLVGKMEKIAQGNSLFGFTVRLDDADFRNYYIPKVKPKKVNFDSRYGVCFRSAISFLPYMVKDALGRSDFTLNVVVEEGDKNVGASYEIFKELRKEQNWEYAGNLGEVTIGSKKSFPVYKRLT